MKFVSAYQTTSKLSETYVRLWISSIKILEEKLQSRKKISKNFKLNFLHLKKKIENFEKNNSKIDSR